MTQHIAYIDYVNRVHGCWLGRCIAGMLGTSREGTSPCPDSVFDSPELELLPPYDDLDVEALWLGVLEQEGVHATQDSLAKALAKQRLQSEPSAVPRHAPVRSVQPQAFRAELWACIAPGHPELAADLATKSGIAEPAGDFIAAARFLAAAESLAFVEPDLDACLDAGLAAIPADSRLFRLVRELRGLCAQDTDWRAHRGRLLQPLAEEEGAGVLQNLGGTLIALLCGESDFLQTTAIAMCCGAGPACAGALLGIHHAATGLMNRYGFRDQVFTPGAGVQRRSDRLCDLADDVAMIGLAFQEINRRTVIAGGAKHTVIRAPENVPGQAASGVE